MTHAENAPCPIQADHFQEVTWNCCWLRGKAAAYELNALGESDVANAMYTDMTVAQALAFAVTLRETADRLEQRHAHDSPKPVGFAWNAVERVPGSDELVVKPNPTPFEDALGIIREAARWYEKVATMGFGVHAWY